MEHLQRTSETNTFYFQGLLHVYKKDQTVKLSKLFQEFEELKRKTKGYIEDYTISEASLEEVFLDVANQT